jgi:hypothetical protein
MVFIVFGGYNVTLVDRMRQIRTSDPSFVVSTRGKQNGSSVWGQLSEPEESLSTGRDIQTTNRADERSRWESTVSCLG